LEGESLEVSGKSVAEAIKRATELTGRPESDLQVTVLSEGRAGILGIGGEDAHIIVAVKAPAVVAEPVAEAPARRSRAPRREAKGAAEGGAPAAEGDGHVEIERERAPITEELSNDARMVLLDLLDLMSMDTDVEAHVRDNNLVLEVIGEDLGLLIGRRGETLAALQFVLNLVLAKRLKKWARVVVDVEGYRARREETLGGLARRIAFRVNETGQPIALEAMPANERRIIHMALADNPNVATGSVGEGDHRKVVISPKR
jgi:spoIIIJ-associated protein